MKHLIIAILSLVLLLDLKEAQAQQNAAAIKMGTGTSEQPAVDSNYINHSNTSISTTEAEYTYITKGYKVQIESGLDMKKGYHLVEFYSCTEKSYNFNFKLLIREATNQVAAIMVTTYSNVSGKTYYSCIPVNNETLLQRYYSETLYYWDSALSQQYTKALSRMYSQLSAHLYESDNKQKIKKK